VRYARSLRPSSVGRRVVVRYTDVDGSLRDATGDLLAWRDGLLTVRTRRADVAVPEAAIVAGKPIPERRLASATQVDVAALHRLADATVEPGDRRWLGGWLLRAGAAGIGPDGSVLPLGDPGPPLEGAVRAVVDWYAERGRRPAFTVPLPDAGTLDAALAAAGWPVVGELRVLVTDVEPAPTTAPGGGSGVDGDVVVAAGWARLSPTPSTGPAEVAALLRRAADLGARHALACVPAGPEQGDVESALTALSFRVSHTCRLRAAPGR
jgi:hypothetical protein